MSKEKPLTHWLFPDLPPKKEVPAREYEEYVCVGLTREDGRSAEATIRGAMHSQRWEPHLQIYNGLVGMEKVWIGFSLTQPSVSKWHLEKNKEPTNLEDIYILLSILSVKLSEKGMGICEVEVEPIYAPAVPQISENITGWQVKIVPSWIKEAVPHQALERWLDTRLRKLVYPIVGETGRLAEYFMEKLKEAGIPSPAQHKSEFEKALDITKTYEENVKRLDRVIAKITSGVEGEIIKQHGNWILTRENLEWNRYKPPNYFYRVYYKEGEKWILSEQGEYSRCYDHFKYQSKFEEPKPWEKPIEEVERIPSRFERYEKERPKFGKLKLSWGKNPRGMWSLFNEFYVDSYLQEKGYSEVAYDTREKLEKKIRDFIHETVKDWREIRNVDLHIEPPVDIILSSIPLELIMREAESTVTWHNTKYYAYGSVARPLEWLTIRSAITSVPHTALVRLSRRADYAGDSPYFDILLSPQPLTEVEVKGLELKPLEKMPETYHKEAEKARLPWQSWVQPILTYITDKTLSEGWVREEDAIKEWVQRGATEDEVKSVIAQLIREGTLYTPRAGFLRKT